MDKNDVILNVVLPAITSECFCFENGELCVTHDLRLYMYLLSMGMISDNLY